VDRLDLAGIGRAPEPQKPVAMLRPEAFFMGCEILFSHLRLKESDRWSEGVALVKLASFTDAFPEVSDRQFLWCCEEWVQAATGNGFRTVPPWRELVAPLYRAEAGLANRSWGFKPDLPPFLQPTPQQLQLVPRQAQSLLSSTDPSHSHWQTPEELKRWTAANGSQMRFEPGDETPLLEDSHDLPT
jgi:hypothetical protein